MVYSPLDALRIAKREPRPRGRLLRDRLRDDRAVDRADAQAREGRGRRELLVHVQPRDDRAAAARAARLARPAARRLHRPGPRVRPSSARGRSSSSPPTTASRWSISGFEPLDILQSIQMILRQLADGPLRGREPVQARRALRGQPARARGDGRGVRAAPALRVARPRASSPRARCSSPTPTPTSTPSGASRCPACASPTRRRASAARCSRASSSRGSARCSAPPARPSAPIGTCMVSPEGACAAYYNYGRFAREREVV